jgi:hypothetical protein
MLMQLMAQTREIFTGFLNQRANVCMRRHAPSLASHAFVSRARLEWRILAPTSCWRIFGGAFLRAHFWRRTFGAEFLLAHP